MAAGPADLSGAVKRQRNGSRVPSPAILSIVSTAIFGWLDEGIQYLLPNRIYDLRDVGFNALAGLMAVLANLVLTWARKRWDKQV